MEILLITITLIILIIASITDLKTREVPDWLSYSFILISLATVLIYSLTTEFIIFIYSLTGFTAMFALGALLYYTKQWGGADAKILMGLGAVFPIFGLEYIFILLIAIVFIGGFYSLAWGLAIYIKHLKKANKKLISLLKEQRTTRFILVVIAVIALISMFLVPTIYQILIFSILILLIFLFYLTLFVKTVEQIGLIQLIPTPSVTEGDWLAKSVKHNNKILISNTKTCLVKKDLSLLKKHKIKSVWIKVGIPFIPAIFLAVLTTIIIYFMGLGFPL
ncbi:prepilin peptidase [archaeon]|jgi:prepilin peptidase CpaA|nr:prepilin peptidase [archaeon]MBT4417201.1 prepilin peptidase [archaeon]